jgi:hypothetical protein
MMKFLAKLFGDESLESPSGGRPPAATSAVLRKAGKKPLAHPPAPAEPVFTLDAQTVDSAADDHDEHFDPYNTGVFDRGATWDRAWKREQ